MSAAQSERSTQAVVNLACLERNWQRLRAVHTGGRVMTVLKANAYGHGMVPAARFLQGLGQELFGVALLDEALTLRHAGITGRILVLGPPEPGRLPVYGRHRIEATLPSLHHLREAAAAAREGPLVAHLKCDTGMGRIGLRTDERTAALQLLREAPELELRGVFSHFADAEQLDSPYCEAQAEAFGDWQAHLREALPTATPEFHLANSAGLLRDPRFHLDYARVGFALWAPPQFAPAAQTPPAASAQEAAVTLRTRVTLVKEMPAGASVGYGRTYRCSGGEIIATLPVGYGDGYFRAQSNHGAVVINGRRCPIAGRISMDQTTVSLGVGPQATPCAIGDPAILLGGGAVGISAAEMGAWAGTIDYEVLTNIGARVPRIYTYDGVELPEP